MSKIIARPIGMLMLFSAAFAGSQPAYSGMKQAESVQFSRMRNAMES